MSCVGLQKLKSRPAALLDQMMQNALNTAGFGYSKLIVILDLVDFVCTVYVLEL